MIAELGEKTEEWDNFVRAHADSTFYHLSGWRDVIERSFGCKTFYLYSKKTGAMDGILPLALVKRPVFGPALISLPLCVYGGAVGNTEELEETAARKAEELGAEYLELRNRKKTVPDWLESERFYTFRRALSQDNEENLKAIPRKQRAEVRKGVSANLETDFNQDIDTFYKIYAASVRNLGTPIFPKKYLKNLLEAFGKDCEVTTISQKGGALTSVLSFIYRDEILPYYGGGLPEARNTSAYPFMYWKVMEHAAQRGIKIFDFGRSMKDSGAYHFKKNFGFEPEKLSYQYHLVKAKEIPDMDPDSPRNKMITSLWRKLPLPVANKLGPYLYPVIM